MLQQVPRRAVVGRTVLSTPPAGTETTLPSQFHTTTPSRSSTARGEPGAATNIQETASSSGEASQINQSRSTDGQGGESKSTTARPVSNPEQSGLCAQEEPDYVKKSNVKKQGQKPLDRADHGYGAAKDPKVK